MINQTIASSLVEANIPMNVLMCNSAGFMAKLNDADYFSINAHSKHGIEPALKSGIDYYHYTVDSEKNKKDATDAMHDGRLLHLLTLERAEFDKMYTLQSNFDKKNEGNPLYFENSDAVKAFVVAHNKKHVQWVETVEMATTAFNKASNSSTKEITDYSKLPLEYQTAEVSKNRVKTLLASYEDSVFTLVEMALSDEELDSVVNHTYNTINEMTDWINVDFSKKWEKAATSRLKARELNQLINIKLVNFNALNDEEKINTIPLFFKEASLNKGSMTKALKHYQAHQKNQITLIEKSLTPNEKLTALLEQGCNEELNSIESHYREKLINIGNKHPEKGTWDASDVLELISSCYNSPTLFKPSLVESEQAQAERENKKLITPEILEHANTIVQAIYECPEAKKWLQLDGNEFEIGMFWNDEKTGDLCKGKADVVNLIYNIMIDLKFVRTVDYDRLDRDSGALNYHIQDAMYRRGFNQILSKEHEGNADEEHKLNKFIFIVVEKDAPKLGAQTTKPIRVRVVEYTDPCDIERAEQLIDAAIWRINKWSTLGYYEGFNGLASIQVPVYQRKQENNLLDLISLEKQTWDKEQEEHAKAESANVDNVDSEKESLDSTPLVTTNHLPEIGGLWGPLGAQ
ncbi:exodeoxyribonuclease VIII [Aliivibrio fischeri]|uniref:PD-(D/E)XK nuclease-like domain-containing protein n=1 Tax=Aliivibrio fischeri TaxID=668 RepID=UPI0012D87EC5|nr:PD-(D/E)XK nuclease-like domain-containing protein [Aliivibrio fischeri]MUK37541.1 exodeoxyribonuclease VIII [Aliivibrio fischeri]